MFCGPGWFIAGPKKDIPIQAFTLSVYVLGGWLYIHLYAEAAWSLISPVIAIVFGLISLLSIALFCLTLLVDPGYIPRQSFFTKKYVTKPDADLDFLIEGKITVKKHKPVDKIKLDDCKHEDKAEEPKIELQNKSFNSSKNLPGVPSEGQADRQESRRPSSAVQYKVAFFE